MSRAGRSMFWWSLVAAGMGVAAGVAMKALDVKAFTEHVPHEAVILAYVGSGILAILGFMTAWHGGAVAAQGDASLTAAGWGVIPSLFMASTVLALAGATFWFLQIPLPVGASQLLLPAVVTAILGWELGFFAVRPRGARPSEGP